MAVEPQRAGETLIVPQILVDADACQVKDEIISVAERHDLPVVMVANSGMRPLRNPLVRQVVVSDGFDAADDWIAENARAGDIAVTADIPLAAETLLLPHPNRIHVQRIKKSVATLEMRIQQPNFVNCRFLSKIVTAEMAIAIYRSKLLIMVPDFRDVNNRKIKTDS